MGIATQASFPLDRPTLGVAKTYYRVDGADYTPPADRPGASTLITSRGEVLGAAVRTRQGVKPVFVSTGNHIDLDTAITVTCHLVDQASRLPVPLRQADLATHRARRQAQTPPHDRDARPSAGP
jgi:deoxyribonuclease V